MNRRIIGPVFAAFFLIIIVLFTTYNVNLFSRMEGGTYSVILGLMFLSTFLALVFGALYMLFGYGKNVAKLFKLFLASLLVANCMSALFAMLAGKTSLFLAIPYLIEIILLSVLTFAENLGEQKSRTIAILLILSAMVKCGYSIYVNMQYDTTLILAISPALTRVFLMVGLLLAIDAKYIDKTERGTT